MHGCVDYSSPQLFSNHLSIRHKLSYMDGEAQWQTFEPKSRWVSLAGGLGRLLLTVLQLCHRPRLSTWTLHPASLATALTPPTSPHAQSSGLHCSICLYETWATYYGITWRWRTCSQTLYYHHPCHRNTQKSLRCESIQISVMTRIANEGETSECPEAIWGNDRPLGMKTEASPFWCVPTSASWCLWSVRIHGYLRTTGFQIRPFRWS